MMMGNMGPWGLPFLLLLAHSITTGVAKVTDYCTAPSTPKHATFTRIINSNGAATQMSAYVYKCHIGYTTGGRAGGPGTYQLQGPWQGSWMCSQGNMLICSQKQSMDEDCSDVIFGKETARGVTFACQNGAVINADGISTCGVDTGNWTLSAPECFLKSASSPSSCLKPPDIDNSHHNLQGRRMVGDLSMLQEGSLAIYRCSSGYAMEDRSRETVTLRCSEGDWKGLEPVCVRNNYCHTPADVPHGNWVILKVNPDYTSYGEDTKILYECEDGYEIFGHDIIECQQSGYWNNNPPQCLLKDSYCKDPGEVPNGFYICTPSHCSMFSRDTKLHFICHEGFEPEGEVTATCLQGGEWTNKAPTCVAVHTTPVSSESDGGSIRMNTNAIVAATSCCILILLIVVMGMVLCQRNICPSRFTRRTRTPAATQTVQEQQQLANALPDQDTLRLLHFQGNAQVVLPSYEEAMRMPASRAKATPTNVAVRRSRPPGEFRPLPQVNPSLRSHVENNNTAAVHDREQDNIQASSTVNPLYSFGSLDTVNISDATSTTVTVDTMNSAVSNPSITPSQRALSSLASDNNFAINDDVQLIDNSDCEENTDMLGMD